MPKTLEDVKQRIWKRAASLEPDARQGVVVFSGPESDGMEVGEVDIMARNEIWVFKTWSPSLERSDLLADAMLFAVGFEEGAAESLVDLGYKTGIVLIRDPDGPAFPGRTVRQAWKDACSSESVRLKWVCK